MALLLAERRIALRWGVELWSARLGPRKKLEPGARVPVLRDAAELRRSGAGCPAPLIGEGGRVAPGGGAAGSVGPCKLGERRAAPCRSGGDDRRWACGTQTFC
ncbi:hypothetical protein NDU88_005683 [Pleurodeles waltl]|uniref:Uncharacterized protein n=1 Tax=Pleurodeles waltl TaxID=8319 RepID=A0AAV7WCI9_PLEWA|nr:hypothetical protein NDU88_005683 [Pleurodeles waltl]